MLEEKEQYTLEELCEGLEISMSKFAKLANVDEGTIARLRKGQFGRIGTINRLLRTFSEIYGRKFTRDNVSGLKKVEKPIKPIDESVPVPPKQESMPVDMVETASPPLPSTIANGGMSAQTDRRKQNEGTPGRTWKQPKKESGLPDGCILYSDFAKSHGIAPTTLRDHMKKGLGPGLIGMSTDTIPQRDQVSYHSRPKPNRKGETEMYFDKAEQHAALEFWKRHSVDYSECDQPDCTCHTLKGE
jgi:hypothetical protein